MCIELGRATEATFQTGDCLCGCDEHIGRLERRGRAAIRRQRIALRYRRVVAADAPRQRANETAATRDVP
ncbi:hypothetical protein A5706_01880 [Mycobacterium sp. E796]|nr:hypothetical protein A5706_01880 [Mycobacterium sp. E796]